MTRWSSGYEIALTGVAVWDWLYIQLVRMVACLVALLARTRTVWDCLQVEIVLHIVLHIVPVKANFWLETIDWQQFQFVENVQGRTLRNFWNLKSYDIKTFSSNPGSTKVILNLLIYYITYSRLSSKRTDQLFLDWDIIFELCKTSITSIVQK